MSHSTAAGSSGTTGSSGGAGDADDQPEQVHKAGAFDIRVFIAALIGIYGVVLLLTGLFTSEGRTINLSSGAGMVVVSALFIAWARIRPVVVAEDPEKASAEASGDTGGDGGDGSRHS